MYIMRSALCAIVFLCAPLHTYIRETDSLVDIVDIGDQNTLVVFDLDDTLIRGFGAATDEWFRAHVKELVDAGKTASEAIDMVLPAYAAAQCTTRVQFVENSAPDILTELRTRKIRTIALTSRGRKELFAATFRQFSDLGITLKQDDPAWQQMFTLEPLRGETRYQDGIIFCDGNNKGAALEVFFERLGYRPTHIIFVDDSLGNLQAVEKLAEKLHIRFNGFHYLRVQHGLLDQPILTPSYASSTPSSQQETSVQ